jgi:membrane protease YdiL (CAAX protease family)
MIVAIILVCTVFGMAVAMNYLKNKTDKKQQTTREVLNYFVVFLAIAGGLIHMSIYIEHAPLRIEYAMFLLLAAISQVGFGVLFLTVLMFESSTEIIKSGKSNYKKNIMIYLFGLIGSVILVGLYTYVVTFSLPLSSYPDPEHIEISGIIAKSLEISLIVIISYLLYYEHMKKK